MKLSFEAAKSQDADVVFCQAQQLVHRYEDPDLVDFTQVENWMRQKISTYIHTYQRVLLDGAVVGYFRLEDQDDRTELDDFYILPEYRSRGIGRLVMHHCLQVAKYPIYFYVFCENARAISFYQRCGFQKADCVSKTRMIMVQEVDS